MEPNVLDKRLPTEEELLWLRQFKQNYDRASWLGRIIRSTVIWIVGTVATAVLFMSITNMVPLTKRRRDEICDSINRRLSEWLSSLIFIFCGLLMLSPLMARHSGLILSFFQMGLSEEFIGGVFLVFGLCKLSSMLMKGHHPWIGPIWRSVNNIIAAALFFQMALGLVADGLQHGRFYSLGIPIFVVLGVGELYSVFSAARDAKRVDDG